jgi:P2-related tail formation protein
MSGDCRTVLPTNIDERLNALDVPGCERLEPLDGAAKALPTLRDPMSADPRFLPVIADDVRAAPVYDWMDDDDLRATIANSVHLDRIAGTRGALESALATYMIDADIREWWEYDGDPYHFRLDLASEKYEVTPDLISAAERVVGRYKNVRSHLDDLRIGYLTELSVAVSAGGVGEASCIAEPTEGYECDTDTVAYIYAGAVGEVVAVAAQI